MLTLEAPQDAAAVILHWLEDQEETTDFTNYTD